MVTSPVTNFKTGRLLFCDDCQATSPETHSKPAISLKVLSQNLKLYFLVHSAAHDEDLPLGLPTDIELECGAERPSKRIRGRFTPRGEPLVGRNDRRPEIM
ncbi:hypothetical protein evm_010568 [Chilo suppressalis]|nr:hypothetical protein evm_010568 [Chilo suppressalis]